MRLASIQKQIFFIKSKEFSLCPDCQGTVSVRDTKLRHVIRKDTEEIQWYRLRRLKCNQCNKLHTELPDLMQPYKHYESQSIQDTIDENADNCCGADTTTINRWKASFRRERPTIEVLLIACWIYYQQKQYSLLNHNSLLEIIQKIKPRWLAFVMEILINSGYKIHTQFAFCP
jgi:hypothetical protein